MRIATHIALVSAAALCAMPALAQQQGPRLFEHPVVRREYVVPTPIRPELPFPDESGPAAILRDFGATPGERFFSTDVERGKDEQDYVVTSVCNRRGTAFTFLWPGAGLAQGRSVPVTSIYCSHAVRPAAGEVNSVDAASTLWSWDIGLNTGEPVATPGVAAAPVYAERSTIAVTGARQLRSFLMAGNTIWPAESASRPEVLVEVELNEARDRLQVAVRRRTPRLPLVLGGLDAFLQDPVEVRRRNPGVALAVHGIGDVMDAASAAWLPEDWRGGRLLVIPGDERAPVVSVELPVPRGDLRLAVSRYFVIDYDGTLFAVAPYTLVAP